MRNANKNNSNKKHECPAAVALTSEEGLEDNKGIIKAYLLQSGAPNPVLSNCRKVMGGGLRGEQSGTPRRGIERVHQQSNNEPLYFTKTPQKRQLHPLDIRLKFIIRNNVSRECTAPHCQDQFLAKDREFLKNGL